MKSLAIAFSLIASAALAGPNDLKSFTISSLWANCHGDVVLMACPDDGTGEQSCRIGSGVMPVQGTATIRGCQIRHVEWLNTYMSSPIDYAMIGETQPNGDDICGKVLPGLYAAPVMYPAGLGFKWDTGSDLHVHAQCSIGASGQHQVEATIWYTVP